MSQNGINTSGKFKNKCPIWLGLKQKTKQIRPKRCPQSHNYQWESSH